MGDKSNVILLVALESKPNFNENEIEPKHLLQPNTVGTYKVCS